MEWRQGKRKIRYRPNQNEPFPLSRTSVELYLRCPRCFYLSTMEQYDIATPSGPMSYLPNAVDEMLKNSKTPTGQVVEATDVA